MNITQRAATKIALVALLAVGVLAFTLQHASGAGAAPAAADPPMSFAPHPGSMADAGVAFGALHRPASAADRANDVIAQFGKEESWVRVADARLLATTADGKVWLTPTTDGRVCLSIDMKTYDAHTCDTIERAKTIGIVMQTAGRFIGVVPDGTTKTTLSGDSVAVGEGGVFDIAAKPGRLVVDGPQGDYGLDI